MKTLIKQLVETDGPSGYEAPVRELIKKEIASLADDFRADALGNLIARKGRKSQNGLRIMLSAHIDEIGLMVAHVDENGFARVSGLGAALPETLAGGRVRFLNGVQGVIGVERQDNESKLPELSKIYIDTGARSREDSPVRVGDVAVFERPYLDLGRRIVAKAMDNRAGTAVLIEAMRGLGESPHELYFVFTAQEEVGNRGATVAAYGVDPHLAITIHVTPAGDTPKARPAEIALGKGPAIKVRDSSMISDPRVVRWMTETAENAKIAYQLEILESGTNEASAIQISRGGVPAGCISIPCRYLHTPSEMIDVGDAQNCVALVVELLNRPVPWS